MDDPVVIAGAVILAVGWVVLLVSGGGNPCGPDKAPRCQMEQNA